MEHRVKVAVAGVGHSPVDRRWDGVSMEQTVGASTVNALDRITTTSRSHRIEDGRCGAGHMVILTLKTGSSRSGRPR
ncbi:MAG: hypothetical protein WB697_01030 [Stellaceae bacterium]